MRILIVNIQYYPMVNPNVYRWSAIAEHWTTMGHDVHVICSKAGGEPLYQEINGVSVHRAGHSSLLDWVYNILGTKNRRGFTEKTTVHKISKTRKLLEKLMDGTWRKVYWPDGSCLWYFPARRKAAKIHRENRFDAMITVGLPFTSHLIGSYLINTFPGLKWHMDIQDPFAYSKEFFVNNFHLYGKLNHKTEKRAFEKADSISVTVDTAALKYKALFPRSGDKVSVIPPLFSLPESDSDYDIFDNRHIHLSYFGTFYQNVRSPESLLLIISKLSNLNSAFTSKLRFHIFGEINPAARAVFESYQELYESIEFHGLVDRSEVALAMKQTDFLINIGNTTDYHLPSKSVDYLMSRKPLLNIIQNEKDTFKALLKDYPLLLNINAKEIKGAENPFFEKIIHFIEDHKGKVVDRSLVKKMGERFGTKNIAAKYLELFD
jgi:hypothetical protein